MMNNNIKKARELIQDYGPNHVKMWIVSTNWETKISKNIDNIFNYSAHFFHN